MSSRILVITLPPFAGGVPAITRILVSHLLGLGHDVTVAYYATISDEPDLSPTLLRLALGRRPATRPTTCFDGVPAAAVGCTMPELEFSYYRPSKRWRRLIDAHDRHIVVGGTVLTAYPLAVGDMPHLVWCASTMIGDRADRRQAMTFPRRTFDRWVVGPVQHRMEKRILSGQGRFMAISRYTLDTLIAAGGQADRFSVVPIPVDTEAFSPPANGARAAVVGFAARMADPRKNVGLLMDAVARLNRRGAEIELLLTGDAVPALAKRAEKLGLGQAVRWVGWLEANQLPDFYRQLDVFAIPSHQEGFGIVGTEAMACGVPVISTRCGGPEDYVIDGETGFLVGHDADEMARALETVIADRSLRQRLGDSARTFVAEHYSSQKFAEGIAENWRGAWGGEP